MQSEVIKLSSVLSDNFGKSERHILDGMIEGKSIEKIIEGIPSKRVRKMRIRFERQLGQVSIRHKYF